MAKYILKTDDDVYADIFKVIDVFLMKLIESKKSYACYERNSDGKWFVNETEFSEDYYPSYCSGNAYIIRAEDASKVYAISNKIKFYWIDDVFVTGILRKEYNKIVGRENSLEIFAERKIYWKILKV